MEMGHHSRQARTTLWQNNLTVSVGRLISGSAGLCLLIVLWGCPAHSGPISTGVRTIGPESDEYAAIVAQLNQLAISFDPHSFTLPEPAVVVLDDLARLMIANPELVILLKPGSSDLPSRARARIVAAHLWSRGVPPRQTQEFGFGESSEVEGAVPYEVFVDIHQGTSTLVLPDHVPVLVKAAPGSQIYFVPDHYPQHVCSPKQIMWLGATNHLGELEHSYPPRNVFAVSVKNGVVRAAHPINPRKSPYTINLNGVGAYPACK
jgi:hypothetical protein